MRNLSFSKTFALSASQIIWLKIEHEPFCGDHKDAFDVTALVDVKEASVREKLLYYAFAVKPVRDFTIWNVVQYSMIHALSDTMSVDIHAVSHSPLSEHLMMTNFDERHVHYEMQRTAMN